MDNGVEMGGGEWEEEVWRREGLKKASLMG